MYGAIKEHLEKELEEIKEAGLYKKRAYHYHATGRGDQNRQRAGSDQFLCK